MNLKIWLTSTFILLTLLTFCAYADMVFESWEETVTLTEQGQKVEVTALARIKLPEKYQQTEWKYLFSKNEPVELLQAQVNGRPSKSFFNNELTFDLGQLQNNDVAKISFIYYERHKALSPWFRQAWMHIPPFAAGAKGSMTVIVPDSMPVCAFPVEFTKKGPLYHWEGPVPKTGQQWSFRTTVPTTTWKVVVKNTLLASAAFDGLEVWYPKYFTIGGQSVQAYELAQTPRADLLSERPPYHYMSFAHAGTNKVSTAITATVRTGEPVVAPPKEPKEYLTIPSHEARTLTNFAQRVLESTPANGAEAARRIGQFIFTYMTYDRSYTGKTVGSLDIIEQRRGVCEQYAQLYVALCRAAGIPAIKISGYAYDTEQGWQEHAWALVHINGSWTAMDPTWGLFQGTLPTSHIAFHTDDVHASKYVYTGNIDRVTSRTEAVIAPQ